jgi:aminopeptidase-like protein
MTFQTNAGPAGDDPGRWLLDQMRVMAPHPRSITGDGVRATLADVAKHIPLTVHEVPTGTPVLDWTVPREWNVRSAWLEDPSGRRVVDVADNPLHLLGYSVPLDARMSLGELRPHLLTLPDAPDRIPYRTSYYNDNWGFCLADEVARALPDGTYTVHIDTTLTEGSLTYGEFVLPGRSDETVLISTHVCHPAMANAHLSGIAVSTLLAATLAAAGRPGASERGLDEPAHRLTYRFLFIPGTIGSITWLARNRDLTDRIHAGLVLTGLGDRSGFTYKRSRRGGSAVDRAVELVLATVGEPGRIVDFSPYGYDERQFCSPGFDLPVGRFGRGQHGEYPEYHTSADDLGFVDPDRLAGSFRAVARIVDILERDRIWRNLAPYGEPQLGRRGLYRGIGSVMNSKAYEMGLLWMLSYSDGRNSVIDIAERSGLSFDALADAADALAAADLLAPA